MFFPLSFRRAVPAAALAATAALAVGAAPSAFAQAPAQAVSAAQAVKAATSGGCPLYIVTANGVRFRTGPGTSYSSKGLLYKGDDGTKLSTSGKWMKIRLYGKSKSGLANKTTGWVYKSYVRYDQNCTPTQLD